MASRVPDEAPEDVSPGGLAWGVELPVPPYSQQLHRGDYLHWDLGGNSWCSPTSTSMLLAFHDRLPAPSDYAWVEPGFPDRFVVQAARHVFDYAYKGAGNWSFNTAYAGRHGADAFVTRLRSLTEVETFIAAGRPAGRDRVVHPRDAALRGLRDRGAPAHDHRVRRGRRRDLQRPGVPHRSPATTRSGWSSTGAASSVPGSGRRAGVVYVVHTDAVPLPPPADPAEANW